MLWKGVTMTPLRAKMLHQLQLHRLAPHTQKAYVRAVEDVARFYWRSPDQLTADEIRGYLHHLLVDRHLAWSTCNIVAAGLRFFSLETLGWDALRLHLPPRKGQDLLPRVLSVDELKRLLASTTSLKQRAVLMTTSSAGLRVSEVVQLRPIDIESHPDRMLIRVKQGKGHKDRYTLLSVRLLPELRAYWKQYRPSPWLFPGRPASQPLTIRTA